MSRNTATKPDPSSTQDNILDAAEEVFAENGFHGATTRVIADKAQANSALIHYYFGNKEKLFEAVFARRSEAINEERRQQLTRLRQANRVTLEAILDALLRPTVTLGRDPSRGGAHYARLLVHVASGTDERSQRLTKERYNAIATLFIDQIAAITPGLTRDDAVLCYLNAIAIGMSLMAPTGRAEDLSQGDLRDDDIDAIIAGAVRFISAGIRAIAAAKEREQPT
ncbi:TetR family transcriptional regulator [Pararhodobacter oceanensis]|uniref:TetR/AcrR family transcriptional regulator n=1 Tax=Pararhodobacter oceanensis TaxID=2172121 RepID=UPI003A94DAEA